MDSSNGWVDFPNTCEECPQKGMYRGGMFDNYWPEDEQAYERQNRKNDFDFKWQVHLFPERCNDCHAKAERFRKANQTLKKLENIRELLEVNDIDGEKWKYLKFVTLTWENEWQFEKPELSKKELAAARLSIRRKRDKIASKLNCAGGTDVMENVRKTVWGCYPNQDDYKREYHKHHLHTHGIWVMPYHKSESILKVMKEHGIRDRTRAIYPKSFFSDKLGKEIEISAVSRARNYLLKYITKIPNVKRGNWGLARGQFCESRFVDFLNSK